MKTLKQFTDEINKCVLCGTCRGVCPTFDVARREPASARGKVALCDALLKKEINISEGFIKHMTECVQCMACYESCPNDVNVPDIILAARTEIVKENGLPFIKSLTLRNFLDSERLMPAVMKFASNLQGLFFKGVPEESGLHRRFPLPLIDERRLMPPLADTFFLERRALTVEKGRKGEREKDFVPHSPLHRFSDSSRFFCRMSHKLHAAQYRRGVFKIDRKGRGISHCPS